MRISSIDHILQYFEALILKGKDKAANGELTHKYNCKFGGPSQEENYRNFPTDPL